MCWLSSPPPVSPALAPPASSAPAPPPLNGFTFSVHVHDLVVVLCQHLELLLRLLLLLLLLLLPLLLPFLLSLSAFVRRVKCVKAEEKGFSRDGESCRDFCFSIAICHICGNCFATPLCREPPPASFLPFPAAILVQLSEFTPNFRLNFDSSTGFAGKKKQVADFQLRLLRCRLSCLSVAEGGGRGGGVGGGGGSFKLSACYMQPLPGCNSGFSRLHIRVCMRLPAAVSAKECAL